ncbi:hypothetical protein BH11MYX2_BH11MYX2_12570 [soil metagenome]
MYVRIPLGFQTVDINDGISMMRWGGYHDSAGGQNQKLMMRGPYLYYVDGVARNHVFSPRIP